ncbi:MAG: arginine deiminase family protein [Lachnospiraceae bacterium]|nr:arginine deiminase family protein [Lachnospiraceae bacterium]
MATLQMYMDRSRIENTFTSPVYQQVWGKNFGVDNSVGKIRRILVHCPGDEILQLKDGTYEEEAGARILKTPDGQIRNYWKGRELPDLNLLQKQHHVMTDILSKEGIEVNYLTDPTLYWTNLTFTRDVALMTPKGAILTRFAMYFHQGDTYLTQKFLAEKNIPIIGAIQGKGTIEGGSFSMLDPHTAIVGRSVRINDEGIEQLRALLSYQGIELIVLDMPAYYIHLDEAFVPLDRNKVLVSTFILPFWFLKMLKERGYELIETDRDDPMLTNNCIALEPGKVLFSEKGVKTMKNLEKAGLDVIPVDISEINKLGGGIHCSTLPLLRDSL